MDNNLNELCDRLGVTVDMLVKEMTAYRIKMDIIGIIVCLLVLIISVIAMLKLHKKSEDEWCEDILVIGGMIIALLASVASLIMLPYFISEMIAFTEAPLSATLRILLSH